MVIGGIIFDKDGTLFDFERTWAVWARDVILGLADGNAEKAGRVASDLGFDMGAVRFQPGSLFVAGTSGQIATALAAGLPGRSATEVLALLDRSASEVTPQPVTDLAPLLGALRARGLRLGVATNDSEVPTRAHLRQSGTLGAFDALVAADSGHGAKPDAAPVLACAVAMGVAPTACVMVGDSLHDLHAGRAAGMVTVGVLTGTATAADLASSADVVLPDIGHIPDWLDRIGADGGRQAL